MGLSDDFGRRLAEDLSRAGSVARRRDVLAWYKDLSGYSLNTLLREAQRFGWKPNRKPRADRGRLRTKLSEGQINDLARFWIASRDKKYKEPKMPLWRLIQIAEGQGIIAAGAVSVAQLNRIFRKIGLGMKELRGERDKGDPIWMKAEYPNDWWFVDVTVCKQWYLTTDRRIEYQCSATEAYKNKPGPGEGRPKLVRYMVVDKASGHFYVRYASEERVLPMADFLYEAFSPKPDMDQEPMRGVPWGLFGDKGSVNRAGPIQNMLKRLKIEWRDHMPGNPRAKGTVEVTLWWWERCFETGLKLQPAMTLEELNQWVVPMRQYMNSVKVMGRHGMTRAVAWNFIPEDRLRLPPAYEFYKKLVVAAPIKRKVYPGRIIRFSGEEYQIGGQHPTREQTELVGEEVEVLKSPYKWYKENRAIEVITVDRAIYEVEPVKKDIFGFPLKAAEIGREFKRYPENKTQKKLKEIGVVDRRGKPVSVAKITERLRGNIFHLNNQQFPEVKLIPKKGKQIVILELERKMPRLKALEELERLLGRSLNPEESRELLARMDVEVSNKWIKEVAEEMKRGFINIAIKKDVTG